MIVVDWGNVEARVLMWHVRGKLSVHNYRAAMQTTLPLLTGHTDVTVVLDMRHCERVMDITEVARQRFTGELATGAVKLVLVIGPVARWQRLASVFAYAFGPLPVAVGVVETPEAAQAWLDRGLAANG